VLLPLERGGGGGDGDAALTLLLHPVHLGGAVVDLADLVDAAGVEQEALGHGGLAGVDVGDDADVADLVDLRHGPGHISRDVPRCPRSEGAARLAACAL
jgi:hypothetical protein